MHLRKDALLCWDLEVFGLPLRREALGSDVGAWGMTKSYFIRERHIKNGSVVVDRDDVRKSYDLDDALFTARQRAHDYLSVSTGPVMMINPNTYRVWIGINDCWEFSVEEYRDSKEQQEDLNLIEEMRKTLEAVNHQINRVYDLAAHKGTDPHFLQDTHGGLLLSPLLSTKASLLIAITEARRSRREG